MVAQFSYHWNGWLKIFGCQLSIAIVGVWIFFPRHWKKNSVCDWKCFGHCPKHFSRLIDKFDFHHWFSNLKNCNCCLKFFSYLMDHGSIFTIDITIEFYFYIYSKMFLVSVRIKFFSRTKCLNVFWLLIRNLNSP